MGAVVRTIADDALTLVGEMGGAATQAYGDDQMIAEVVRSFNLLFKKFHWHVYREWFRFELDETTGLITPVGESDLSSVMDFEDFINVHIDAQPTPLPILPKNTNPFVIAAGNGTTPRYWTSLPATHDDYNECKLIFWPNTSVGFVNIHARVHPHPEGTWTENDRMELDKDMLVYGAAYMTLVGDDLNPGAAETCKNLMEMKFKDIMDGLASHRIPINVSNGIPTQWTER